MPQINNTTTTAAINTAAILPSKQAHPFHLLRPAPYTHPGPHEILIRAHAAAVNPADHAIQSKGMLMTSFPAILGCDVAGEVVELGSAVIPANDYDFTIGDRVVGPANCLKQIHPAASDEDHHQVDFNGWEGKDAIYAYSAFQTYVLLEAPMAAKIPDGIKYEETAVLPLAINTSASCLFGADMLGLQLPVPSSNSSNGELTLPVSQNNKNKILIVWAASASVGVLGVQLAAVAGYTVVGVAGAHNLDLVREAGAAAAFDRADPEIVERVVAWCKEDGGEVVGAYDAWSRQEGIEKCCEILHKTRKPKTGGSGEEGSESRMVAAVYFNAEAYAKHGVPVKTNFASTIDKDGLGRGVWRAVGAALAEGRLKCLPKPVVVGHGLERVQEAVDRIGEGVSGTKLVVTF